MNALWGNVIAAGPFTNVVELLSEHVDEIAELDPAAHC